MPSARRSRAAAATTTETPHRAKPADGFTRLFPTHKRDAGDLVVDLPAVGGNSPDPLVITDKGTDVPDAIALHLINSGEASKKAAAE